MTVETAVAPDGKDVEARITEQLQYLSKLARHLGVNDPVEEFFAPVVGRWSDMHAEADRWRVVGEGAEQVTAALTTPLGKLDAAWDGEAAQSFIAYMQKVGLAGNDLSDAMIAMADALDKTANGIREIVVQLATVMAETADTASEAMTLPVQGDDRAREYLDLMRRPTKELFEAVRQILEAFVQLCDGMDSVEGVDAFQQVTMAHTFPTENWAAPTVPAPTPAPGTPSEPSTPVDTTTDISDVSGGVGGGGGGAGGGSFGGGGGGAAAGAPAPLEPGRFTVAGEQAARVDTPAAAAASAGAAAASKSGAGGMPMMPMMPMGAGGGQGGDAEHKSRSRVVGNPQDIFGKPEKASAPVIGDDD